ncbi:GyrI-like domain-containing protein [Microbacterium koreense]|uniref:GyrI-like domain-containing protein n=1 Tax=Microbacterium koreense TaxID=323761 RepID=A0ABW2ZR20_9MICO
MTIDLKKDLKDLYAPPAYDFVEVDVPDMTYLAVDGRGDPNASAAYAEAVEALFTTAYAIRAQSKARGTMFVVGPLEGLWSSADPGSFVTRDKGAWEWTMLIPIPDAVDPEDVAAGLAAARKKKPRLPPVEVRVLSEGRCLQILHVGSYDDEAPTLQRLHDELMPAKGVTFNGPHHEIYLADPRRTAPEKLRTVLRQPITPR